MGSKGPYYQRVIVCADFKTAANATLLEFSGLPHVKGRGPTRPRGKPPATKTVLDYVKEIACRRLLLSGALDDKLKKLYWAYHKPVTLSYLVLTSGAKCIDGQAKLF